jgi:hypothetical protein
MTTELKPGTCVSFKNFTSEKSCHLNGKPGLIKKKLENGSYRVMVNSKNDFQVKQENLNVVEQCPNKPQESEGSAFLMWPDTPRSQYPSLQWIESQELNKICTEYLISMRENVITRKNGNNMEKSVTKDKKKRTEDCEKLSECLKKLLGWKNCAQLRLDTVDQHSEEAIATDLYFVYDAESTAKENKYIKHFFENAKTIHQTVDLTNSQVSMKDYGLNTPEMLKSFFEVPLPVVKGPVLIFSRFIGKSANKFTNGEIVPFSNSPSDVKLETDLKSGMTLNLFALRFKVNHEKSLKVQSLEEANRHVCFHGIYATPSEVIDLTAICDEDLDCVLCKKMLKIQKLMKRVRELDAMKADYESESESDGSTLSLD